MREDGLAICIRVPTLVKIQFDKKTEKDVIQEFTDRKFGLFKFLRIYEYSTEYNAIQVLDDNKKRKTFRFFDTWFRRLK